MDYLCKCTSKNPGIMVPEINLLLSEIGKVAYDKLSYSTKKDNEVHFSTLDSKEFVVGITYLKLKKVYKIWMYDEKEFAKVEALRFDKGLLIANNPIGNIPGKGYHVASAQECAKEIMAILSYKTIS